MSTIPIMPSKMWMQFELSDENKVYVNLLNALLNTKFFDSLRTQQQLGYIVGMGPNISASWVYIVAVVQTEFNPDYARSKIADFFTEHFKWIQEGLEQEEFETCKGGVLSELKVAPKNLGMEMQNWTRGFSERTYDFRGRQRMIDTLEGNTVTLESMRKWVADKGPAAARLYIQVSKVVDKPDKDLPEGATVPKDGDDVKVLTGRDGVIENFEKSMPGWKEWKGSSPDAWKAAEL